MSKNDQKSRKYADERGLCGGGFHVETETAYREEQQIEVSLQFTRDPHRRHAVVKTAHDSAFQIVVGSNLLTFFEVKQ